jgi:hypothetical protein
LVVLATVSRDTLRVGFEIGIDVLNTQDGWGGPAPK